MDFQFSSLGIDEKHQDCINVFAKSTEDKTPRKCGQAIRKGNKYHTSSTPIHHRLEDSGYHSIRNSTFKTTSKRRSNFLETAESFEGNSFVSPQKRMYEDELNSPNFDISSISKLQDDFWSKFEIIERLGFKPSPDLTSFEKDQSFLSSDVENSFKWLEYHIEGSQPDENVASRLVLPQPADCITELHKRNCYGVLSNVFSYLSGKDLTSASVVCHAWNDAINGDHNSRKRKSAYLQKRKKVTKENRTTQYFMPPEKGVIHVGIFGDVLNRNHLNNKIDVKTQCDIVNIALLQMTNEPIESKLMMKKCPACAYACEVRPGILKTVCGRKTCQHEFCAKCFSPYNQKHVCKLLTSAENVHKLVLCSKKSKKYLRRL